MQDVSYIIIALTLTLAAHLVEEIRTDFRRRFPLGPMPKWLMIVGNIVVYLYAFLTITLCYLDYHTAPTLAWIFVLAMLANGAGHLGIMAVRRSYFPGGITAAPLLLISLYAVYRLAL